MKKFILLFSFFVFLFLIFFIACEKKEFFEKLNSEKSETINGSTIPCGSARFFEIISEQNIQLGTLTVYNDQQYIYTNLSYYPGIEIKNSQLFLGKCKEVPRDENNDPDYSQFSFSVNHAPQTYSYLYSIPIQSGIDCYCILLHSELLNSSESGSNIISSWAYTDNTGTNDDRVINYCLQSCRFCNLSSGDFRTQTQGGWGSKPNGNNPGSYLHANFSSAFPNGLKVGCSNGFTILLTSAQAVTDFLPQGGIPTSLIQNYTNPNFPISVLAGQTVALALSVGFDTYDPNFGNSSVSLGNLVISSGTFQGWTVAQLLAEAQKVLGGCVSVYSPAQINYALDAINSNFTNGTQVGNYLVCQP